MQLWKLDGGGAFFLLPDDVTLAESTTTIVDLQGNRRRASMTDLRPYELTEEQARAWAKAELSNTLDELKTNIDAGIAKFRQQLADRDQTPVSPSSPITPDATSAILDFVKALPRVVAQGISGDEARVAAARETMADLQQRLKASGVDVDDRLRQFPERLADIRRKPEENGKKSD
jgi:hypothetical protein